MKLIRVIPLLVLLLFAVQVVAATEPPIPPQAPAQPTVQPEKLKLTDDEAKCLRVLNDERVARGLKPLAVDETLTKVARLHSQDMYKRNYFSHLEPGPEQYNPLDRYVRLLGYRPTCVVGENIATCTGPMIGFMHKSLMESPTHKENILDREYKYVGIGIWMAPDGRTWLTQMFSGDWRRAR